MRRTKQNIEKFALADLLKLAAPAMLLLACVAVDSVAQQNGQKTFSSPEEASKAVVAALQNNGHSTRTRDPRTVWARDDRRKASCRLSPGRSCESRVRHGNVRRGSD
jgi:hypothetical protein